MKNFFIEFALKLLESKIELFDYIEHNKVNFVLTKPAYKEEKLKEAEDKLGFKIYCMLRKVLLTYGDLYDKTTGGGLLPLFSDVEGKDIISNTIEFHKNYNFAKKENLLLIAKTNKNEGGNPVLLSPNGKVFMFDMRDMDDKYHSLRYTYKDEDLKEIGKFDDYMLSDVFRSKISPSISKK
ncbi:hypothetical protein M0R36_09865 [bacterium]|jgi:DNA-directed RNA polymerase subunit N (RpoN/RPB10)|nr:hypothetical protein [bacterium]